MKGNHAENKKRKQQNLLFLRDLEISKMYLEQNYSELNVCHNDYLGIWEVYKPENLERLKRVFADYTFKLSNYLGSYCAMIDHIIGVRNCINNGQLKREYQASLRKSTLMEENKFVIDFRNFIFHKKMPIVGGGVTFLVPSTALVSGKGLIPGTKPTEIKDMSLSVKKSELLKWDGWTPDSLKYINSIKSGIEDEIFIQLLVDELHKSLLQFIGWFRNRISSLDN